MTQAQGTGQLETSLTQRPGTDGAIAVTLRLAEAPGFSLVSSVEKQDLGVGTRRPVGGQARHTAKLARHKQTETSGE